MAAVYHKSDLVLLSKGNASKESFTVWNGSNFSPLTIEQFFVLSRRSSLLSLDLKAKLIKLQLGSCAIKEKRGSGTIGHPLIHFIPEYLNCLHLRSAAPDTAIRVGSVTSAPWPVSGPCERACLFYVRPSAVSQPVQRAARSLPEPGIEEICSTEGCILPSVKTLILLSVKTRYF